MMNNKIMDILYKLEKEGNIKKFVYKGYNCLIRRPHPFTMGHLCGYVEIPKEHKYYEKDYDDIGINCHWGLTFGSHLDKQAIEEKGFSDFDIGYWIGFDCAHCDDLSPMQNIIFNFIYKDVVYRDMEYVENQIKSIVEQLIKEETK